MDKKVSRLIKNEEERQSSTINLIASENVVSRDVLKALGSVFTNKYAEGYPGHRYYGGNEVVDKVENLARERALKLFGVNSKSWHANVQPYSGSPANLAVYLALVPAGGKIMGMRLDMGGHLTHGHKVSATGKLWKQIPYGLNKDTEKLDYEELKKIAKREKPDIVVAGFTAYPRKVNFNKFREIADVAEAYLVADVSHIAGLIAGGAHPSPFRWADVVTMTTHKTLRGPRGAVIFSRKSKKVRGAKISIADAIDKSVFPGLQGGPHMNQIMAMAVAFEEASRSSFKNYAEQVIKNAKTMAELLKRRGWRIVSGGTENHLLLVDVYNEGISGKEAEKKLESIGIIVNKNTVPYEARSPLDPSGIRVGTAAMTTRGMKEKDMECVADIMDKVLRGEIKDSRAKKEVKILAKKFKP